MNGRPITDCRVAMVGLRASFTNLMDPQVVKVRSILLAGVLKSYLGYSFSIISGRRLESTSARCFDPWSGE
jgi:hypothetical protein